MTAVQSEYVIASLREQLSEAHLKIAMLEAEIIQKTGVPVPQQPVLVVSDDGSAPVGGGQRHRVD